MLIVLNRFIGTDGTVTWLPRWDPVQALDTEGSKSNLLPLSAGGTIDPQRGERLPRRQRNLTYKGTLIESSADAIQAAYDALALASGTDGELYGTNEIGTQTVHIHARMLVDAGQRTPQTMYRYRGYWALDVSIVYELQDKVWKGVRHGTALIPLDGGYSLDVGVPFDDVADTTTLTTSPQTITVANDGNMPVDQVDIALLVAGTPVTALTLQSGRAKWTVTGSIPVGNTLRVNTDNASVANETALTADVAAGVATLPVANAAGLGWAAGNRVRLTLTDGTIYEGTIASIGGTTSVVLTAGLPFGATSGAIIGAAAYSGFVRDPVLHTIAPWMALQPGSNSVTITRTGGANSQITFSFWDAWV